MNPHKETIPEILAELYQEQALEKGQILNYANRLSLSWKREKDAARSRLYRLNKKSGVTDSVTQNVTQDVTESVTPYKEERTEKENLPPTPPIREKAKKEETLPVGSAARAHARGDVPSLEEALAASPIVGVPLSYIRWWHNEMTARDWTSTDGRSIGRLNWRAVLRAWYLHGDAKEIAAAKELERARAPVCRSSNPKDWILCIERCAHAANGCCQRGITTPPQLQSRPHPPEECRLFSGKEVAR